MSNSVLTYRWVYLGVIFALTVGGIILYKKKKRSFIRFFMSLPLIQSLVIKIDLTRFMYNLHILLVSGITLMNALILLQDTVLNKLVKKMIIDCQKLVSQGENFSVGLKKSEKITPPLMIKLIEAGEITGTLDQATSDVSLYLDSEVVNTLHYFTALLEPIILVAVAVVVGGMLIAIITPIYGIIGQIGGT
jgi:type II secretory pathway component PulF